MNQNEELGKWAEEIAWLHRKERERNIREECQGINARENIFKNEGIVPKNKNKTVVMVREKPKKETR
jgi:hypothetical protein